MSKRYKRGKFKNNHIFAANYNWLLRPLVTVNVTDQSLCFLNKTGVRCKFVKTLIARGIGYRIFALTNDFMGYGLDVKPGFTEKTRLIYSDDYAIDAAAGVSNIALDFPYSRYLLVRAGHTSDLIMPLSISALALTSKKDRKLAVAGPDATVVANATKKVFSYRPPSVYTGRGIRIKHARPPRKAGKKDKQKGKAF